MITVETIQLLFVALYVLTAIGLFGLLWRVPERLRRYSGLLIAVVVVSGLDLFMQWAGVGSVAVGSGEVQLTSTISQTIQYVVLYGGVAALGGASRRLTAALVVVALFPSYVTQFLPVVGLGEVAALLVIIAVFLLPLPVVLYLFFGPIWRAATQLPPQRRLLYWKVRNLILFVYAMVIAYIGLVTFGLLTDSVLTSLLLQYAGFVFSGGIPTFLIYRFTTDDAEQVPALFTTGATDHERDAATTPRA